MELWELLAELYDKSPVSVKKLRMIIKQKLGIVISMSQLYGYGEDPGKKHTHLPAYLVPIYIEVYGKPFLEWIIKDKKKCLKLLV